MNLSKQLKSVISSEFNTIDELSYIDPLDYDLNLGIDNDLRGELTCLPFEELYLTLKEIFEPGTRTRIIRTRKTYIKK